MSNRSNYNQLLNNREVKNGENISDVFAKFRKMSFRKSMEINEERKSHITMCSIFSSVLQ